VTYYVYNLSGAMPPGREDHLLRLIYLVNYVFKAGPAPVPLAAGT